MKIARSLSMLALAAINVFLLVELHASHIRFMREAALVTQAQDLNDTLLKSLAEADGDLGIAASALDKSDRMLKLCGKEEWK